MNLDWDTLARWDIIFGIIGGFALVGSWVVWAARRAKAQSEKKSRLGFEVRDYDVGLERGGITFNRNEASLDPGFVIQFFARVSITNPGAATSVKLFVA